MVLVVLAVVIGVILYRMSMILALSTVDEETIQSNASLFISATGAAVNLLFILIINQLYREAATRKNMLERYRLCSRTFFNETSQIAERCSA